MTLVKICGNRTIDDISYINQYKPDYAGMILSEGYGRTVTHDTAVQLRQQLDEDIPMVGVFVNDEIESIVSYVNEGIIDVIQLHGNESTEDIVKLRNLTGKPIWKVFQMQQDMDTAQIEECPADLVLLDAGKGSGNTFDWSLCRNIKRSFILAGGLTSENVSEAIEQVKPLMVDTSSGVETDRRKDQEKVKKFIQTIRRQL